MTTKAMRERAQRLEEIRKRVEHAAGSQREMYSLLLQPGGDVPWLLFWVDALQSTLDAVDEGRKKAIQQCFDMIRNHQAETAELSQRIGWLTAERDALQAKLDKANGVKS